MRFHWGFCMSSMSDKTVLKAVAYPQYSEVWTSEAVAMLLVWSSLFSLLLAFFIFVFNVVLLFAVATTRRLHSFSNALAANLWLANVVSAVVALFHNLLGAPAVGVSYVAELGPQILVALFNSNVSLLTLLAIASCQIMARYQAWLPRSAPMRISVSIWLVVAVSVCVNFALMQVTGAFALVIAFQLALLSIFLVINLILHPINLLLASRVNQVTGAFALVIAFQLALLSIFLVINLILHPINLLLASRVNQDPQLSKSITQSLWLLLHSLSFTLLAMMLVWESAGQTAPKESTENLQILSLQLAAYSVHCIANPLIAVIRDPQLAHAIAGIIYGKGSRRELMLHPSAQEPYSYFYQPERWLMGHIPPPPPYMSQSNSVVLEADDH
uniref:G_PROTEIN_RECEP_F1_2 domain-containing protein n=1 Tax=Steinernema glaseri TaxID=37863 RepID=A0A1I7ZBT2_9BILA